MKEMDGDIEAEGKGFGHGATFILRLRELDDEEVTVVDEEKSIRKKKQSRLFYMHL